MMTRLLRGLPEGGGARDRVAELYWQAFGAQLGPALGPAAAGRRFIAAHLDPDRALTAVSPDGRVLGVVGFQLAGRGLIGGDTAAVRAEYGQVRGLWRAYLLALSQRTPARGELVLDGIAVDRSEPGLEVEALLLEGVEAVAAEQGCRRVRLDVAAGDTAARARYEGLGFRAVRVPRTPWPRDVLGFGAVTTLHRSVPPQPGT
ncbi:N-acetyltransferase [Streptomyces cirratus]|uniref:N-acetyltransferase n=1 Tax=Streptomyces cirratus TaxID=68187 RepID=A0ABQ3EZ51_9ACTN|nr:GNAT family N-acetyltransferase [Streptomyces cirratus]GHB70431.1 N-acetyltransferase [Streptomyces cirratus]